MVHCISIGTLVDNIVDHWHCAIHRALLLVGGIVRVLPPYTNFVSKGE